MCSNIRHKSVLVLKRLIHGRRGEPYKIAGQTLRYQPGTRPMRLRYIDSKDVSARYDALQIKLFSETLQEGDTAIDIGAHCGQYCILMAAKCGQTGNVVAFEPDPYAREKLLLNLTLNPQLKRPRVEACAVSDRAGEAVLFSRGGNSQSSLVRSGVEFSNADHSEEIRVPLVVLDSYLIEKGLPHPRWVKIDTEGAEIRILQGAPQLVQSDAGIVCELHPYAWPEFGNTFSELKALAAAAGRRIRYLDEDMEIGDVPHYGTVALERRP